MSDVWDTFVTPVPIYWGRERLYGIVEYELSLLAELPGINRAWIGGPFASQAPAATKDYALVLGIADNEVLLDQALQTAGILERLTMLRATFLFPYNGKEDVVRPMGGAIDAYLTSPRRLVGWHHVFSVVPEDSALVRGHVEVRL